MNRYTEKTKVTQSEYLQLVGLLTLAKTYTSKLEDILKLVIKITGEKNDMGHSSDAVYSPYSVDELIKKLEITVREKEQK